jgi:putative ABC transport system permease protein
MSFWSRLANVFRGEHLTREIDEELQSHMEEALAEGREPAEVRRAFGSPLHLREESRDVRFSRGSIRCAPTPSSAGANS